MAKFRHIIHYFNIYGTVILIHSAIIGIIVYGCSTLCDRIWILKFNRTRYVPLTVSGTINRLSYLVL